MLTETPCPLVVLHDTAGIPADSPGGKFQNVQHQDAPAIADILTTAVVLFVISAHHHLSVVLTHGVITKVISPAVCSVQRRCLPSTLTYMERSSH